MNKLKILLQSIIGNLCKIRVWYHLWFNIKPKYSEKIAKNVIVSFTSYGRRVAKCAPYAVFSMMVQTVRPEKITLWLDKEKWNDENLPLKLKRMKDWGMVNIEYCKDVRSFTKLIPALDKYHNKAIITIDDDIYYSSNVIETLYESYVEHPDKVIALCTTTYYTDSLGKSFSSKMKNKIAKQVFEHGIGAAGILYPPHCFHSDIDNYNLYMDLCPFADDLWFYFMSFLNNVPTLNVEKNEVKYYYLDFFYQKMHHGSRLYDIVKFKDLEQMDNIIKYYKIY